MASIAKFTHSAMSSMLRHNSRLTAEPSNVDIDPERSELNYSIEMDHGGLSNYEYYKKVVDESYLYGRGTQREDKAITACGLVVTAPKEICGDHQKEQQFFSSVLSFTEERFEHHLVDNAIHYDEAGAPHIHITFVPVTKLDHDKVHYKTSSTKEEIKLDSGRYEYGYRFLLDENGQKIPLKNYARISDYYDVKISAKDVINKAELKHFHTDLQQYLDDNHVEGRVVTGNTGGINFSVQELKEFTKTTGLRLEEVKEIQNDRHLLESYVEKHEKITELNEDIIRKDEQIEDLTKSVYDKNIMILEEKAINAELQAKIEELEHTIEEQQREIDCNADRIKELEEQHQHDIEQIEELEKNRNLETNVQWGHSTTWGQTSSWGNSTYDRTYNYGDD